LGWGLGWCRGSVKANSQLLRRKAKQNAACAHQTASVSYRRLAFRLSRPPVSSLVLRCN
jgi:hypothetical protein